MRAIASCRAAPRLLCACALSGFSVIGLSKLASASWWRISAYCGQVEALFPSSCAGLTRASMLTGRNRERSMDCRFKPGNDEWRMRFNSIGICSRSCRTMTRFLYSSDITEFQRNGRLETEKRLDQSARRSPAECRGRSTLRGGGLRSIIMRRCAHRISFQPS